MLHGHMLWAQVSSTVQSLTELRGPKAAHFVARSVLLLQGRVCSDSSSLPRSDAVRCDG